MNYSAIAAMVCAILVSGCAAYHPRDLTLVSVEAVDYREQAEFPTFGPYAKFLYALWEKKGGAPITPEDVEVYFQQQKNNQWFRNLKRQRPLLRVEFTSNENLLEYTKSGNSDLSIWPFFCARPVELINWGALRVYSRRLDLSRSYIGYAIELEEGEVLTYYAYLEVFYDFTGVSSYEQFDLRTEPEDVCFRVRGGWIGNAHISNVVVIPKEDIVEALKGLPPALRDARRPF